MQNALDLQKYRACLDGCNLVCARGRVTNVIGLMVEAVGPVCRLGTVCEIQPGGEARAVTAEVLGFRDDRVLLMPLEEMRGIGPGCLVTAQQDRAAIPVGRGLLGRVVDGLGLPIDGKGPIVTDAEYPIYAEPLNPLKRSRIRTPLDIGVRAVNGLLTIGCGQRVGIFAGSGVGKSILLGMMARHTAADVNVIALIGERGREVNEFIEKELGEEGLKRSVIVVATSDHLPLIRLRGAYIATAIAEYFRDLGQNVLLMMDSVTRFAMAQREIGLALGEPPTTKGYTPSVFTLLPRLLERAGTSAGRGTITGLYTVLVEGDDTNEPIADALRATLDGHICLSRELAMQNHYPAIDVLSSISRVMDDVVGPGQREWARTFKSILATYKKSEDLINIGAYVAGSNSRIDRAIRMINRINQYLTQGVTVRATFEESVRQLEEMIMQAGSGAPHTTTTKESA
ncbi:MAG: flagellar protein export ATPase FliI [Desulfobacterales bacterium]|nr:flagellar protein export ATPase FliI [Desulfobacterales bacterium]